MQPVLLTLYSLNSGEIVRQYEQLRSRKLPLIEWKRDSSGFYFVERKDNVSLLQERDLTGNVVRTLKQWQEEKVFQMALSADGKRLFVEKGEDVISILKFENATPG